MTGGTRLSLPRSLRRFERFFPRNLRRFQHVRASTEAAHDTFRHGHDWVRRAAPDPLQRTCRTDILSLGPNRAGRQPRDRGLRAAYDVYFGVASRSEEASGKSAINRVQALWIDLDPDSPGQLIDVMAFPLEPSIVVSSGRGHHFYWVLDEPINLPLAESLNRRLAKHLGSDERVSNADRILRVAGTINHKDGSEVKLLTCTDVRYTVAELETHLPLQPPEAPSEPFDEAETPFERFLQRLDVATRSGRSAKAHCPAHDDANPSLSVKEAADGRVLAKCHAGCSFDQVVAAVGLTPSDMFAEEGHAHPRGDRRAARAVVALADEEGVELFHNRQQDAYASFRVPARDEAPEHFETHPVGSRAFELWLRKLYFESCDDALSDQAVREAVSLLEARAQFAGPQREVHRRLAGDLERLYVDLGDAAWRVVEVTPEGWRLLDRAPVAFVRDAASKALPEPVPGGSIDDLRSLTNFSSDSDWMIFRGALLGAYHPTGPYMLLLLLGGEGTAKTTTAKHIFSGLTDPMVGAFPVGTPSSRDIAVAARVSRVVGFDNVGSISPRLSDLLCQLISGGGVRERMLYTNGEVFADEIKVLVVMTSRTQVVQEADLIDRTAVARLRPLAEEERREEAEVLTDLERIKGAAFGGLLDAVAGALREYSRTRPSGLPRLADITRFVTAAERAMGWDVGSFHAALAGTQADSLVESIESSLYASAVVSFMTTRAEWSGTSSELLKALTALAEAPPSTAAGPRPRRSQQEARSEHPGAASSRHLV